MTEISNCNVPRTQSTPSRVIRFEDVENCGPSEVRYISSHPLFEKLIITSLKLKVKDTEFQVQHDIICSASVSFVPLDVEVKHMNSSFHVISWTELLHSEFLRYAKKYTLNIIIYKQRTFTKNK